VSESPPFAFQAAKASWAAPLLACALGFGAKVALGNNSSRPLDPETLRIAWISIGAICAMLAVAGLILGIVALFGIAKHGWKQILIPSVAGILLSSGYIYLLVSTVLLVRRLAAQQGIG
jgi:hypothetical protein